MLLCISGIMYSSVCCSGTFFDAEIVMRQPLTLDPSEGEGEGERGREGEGVTEGGRER